jgi:toxin ParE1/3/4
LEPATDPVEIIYHQEAFEEGIEAAIWYESQSEGLELRFLRYWKEAEERMAACPDRNRVFFDGMRRCRFEVFPHSLVYRICPGDAIEVLAVMHSSRRPGYWADRKRP